MSDQVRAGAPVLITCLNFSGLVNPLLSIAGELVRQHAQVWFCTNEERADQVRAVESGAVRFASLGPTPVEHDPVRMDQVRYEELHPPSRLRSFAAILGNADFARMDAMYERMLEVIDEVRPGVLFVDTMSLFAVDAAVTRGVPYVLSHCNPVSALFADRLPWSYPVPLSGLPRRMSTGQHVRNVLFRLGRGAVAGSPGVALPALRYVRSRKRRGLWNPAMSLPKYLDRAEAIVASSVFGFEYPFPGAPDELAMLGAMVPPDRDWGDGSLRSWLDANDSVVLAGFGTMMRHTPVQARAIVDAAAMLGPTHKVLWKLPGSHRHLLPDRLPPNLRVEEWFPSQLNVLEHPHVRVFFNQAGGNAVHESLYFGKPMLVLPFWLDCHDFAARAVDAGVALAVGDSRGRVDGGDIAQKLRRLLTEPSFSRQARHWGEQLRAAGGIRAAADLLVQHATRTPDSARTAPDAAKRVS